MADTSSKTLHPHPLIETLLRTRGHDSIESAAEFLQGDYESGLHDPYLLNDMQVAVDRILAAIEEQEHIVIYSDYDCDGIPGGVVLHDFFTAARYTNFSNYIPHRHYEGFGLSSEAIEKLKEKDAKLIISVDCGSTDVAAVATAALYGIDVIITDHHEPPEVLPAALALVNPKVGDSYPFKDLCGSGVVFKLVQALLATSKFNITPGREKWWLDMVGMATIADMVPLVGENRILARYGLTVLRKSRRPGLIELLRRQRASQRHLNEDDIGFTIGPRINAASRMDAPEEAFRLLATTDDEEAVTLAMHLEKLNNERKGAVAAMTREAHGILAKIENIPDVLVIGNPSWRPSLAGLVANKLAEEHNRPTFVWGRDGSGILKGSARSNGEVSVVKLMDGCAAAFTEYGGHHFSGGFSLSDEAVHDLANSLNQSYMESGEELLVPDEQVIDADLSPQEINKDLVDALLTMAPFGVGNHKPLFRLTNTTPQSVLAFGKEGIHTKILLQTGFGRTEAIAFFKSPTQFGINVDILTPLSLLIHIERSHFMGRLQTRLRIVDVV